MVVIHNHVGLSIFGDAGFLRSNGETFSHSLQLSRSTNTLITISAVNNVYHAGVIIKRQRWQRSIPHLTSVVPRLWSCIGAFLGGHGT